MLKKTFKALKTPLNTNFMVIVRLNYGLKFGILGVFSAMQSCGAAQRHLIIMRRIMQSVQILGFWGPGVLGFPRSG